MVALKEAFQLLSLLISSPGECYDRVVNKLESLRERISRRARTYPSECWDETAEQIGASLGVDIGQYADEPELTAIEAHVRAAIAALPADGAFAPVHNADFVLAKACYVICRALAPSIVVETGVAHGVTSAFLLKALEKNGRGVLHSVDLPPLGQDGDRFVGIAIPEDVRARWRLHRGASKRILPALLREVGAVDIFIHDSLHTYRNIRQELETVAPYFAPRAMVIADDVQMNAAFADWVAASEPRYSATVREEEKESVFGVCVFGTIGAAHATEDTTGE